MAGEPSWRGQLRSTLHSGDADDVETRVLGCVEELLTKEAEKQRSRAQFQQGILDKKMASLRSAAELEGQHMATKLQESHRKALAKLHDELAEMQAEYEAKINEQAAFEEQLKQKISELGGADAAMALERERYIKHLGKSAVKRMLNAALTAGWQSWKSQWAELQKIKQASFRLRNAGIARSWYAWLELRDAMKEQKRMLSAAASRLMRPKLVAAYVHWKDDFDRNSKGGLRQRLEDAQRALVEATKEQERLREMLAKAEREAARRENQGKEKMAEALQRSAVRRMRNVHLAAGWSSWLDTWQEERQKAAMKEAVLRMQHAAMSKGWTTWHALWEAEVARRRLLGAAGRLMNQQLSRAWTTWVELWEHQSRVSKMTAAGTRLKHLAVAVGWSKWRDTWEAERATRVLVLAARQLLNQQLSRGWRTWRGWYEAEAYAARLLRNALNQLTSPLLSMAFAHWADDWRVCSDAEREAARERRLALQEEELRELRAAFAVTMEEGEEKTAIITRQEIEIVELRRDAKSRQLHHETLQRQAAEVSSIRREALVQRQQLSQAREEAKEAAAKMSQLEEQLIAAGTPLAVQQRREIILTLMREAHTQMELLSETVAADQSGQIRQLEQLVALRDRQLIRTTSSPRFQSPRVVPMPFNERSHDTKPLWTHRRPATNRPATASIASGRTAPAGLFVTPSLPEAASSLQRTTKRLAQTSPSLTEVETRLEENLLSPPKAKSTTWQSPYVKRSTMPLQRPRSADVLSTVLLRNEH